MIFCVAAPFTFGDVGKLFSKILFSLSKINTSEDIGTLGCGPDAIRLVLLEFR